MIKDNNQNFPKIVKPSFKLLLIVFVLGLFVSCKPTRWVENGDYLLQKNKIEIDNKSINKNELESYYRQQPNRRFLLFFKFHLAAYNFSQIGKERKIKKWIARVIGEEPVVYDSILVERSKNQFVKYLKNEAYYNAKISYKVDKKRKRAWVTYNIIADEPIIVRSLSYQIEDSTLHSIVFSDTINRKIQIDSRMTLNSLETERNRLVTQLRDSGYYEFNNEFIKYKVDTFNFGADITLILEKVKQQDSTLKVREYAHKKYWINKVYFMPDFEPQKAIRDRKNYFNTFDTTYYEGFGFIYPGFENVKPKVILKANTIVPGDQYNFSRVNNTTRYFNSLRLFRLNNLGFYRSNKADSLINCVVQLTPSVYQNYSVNFESTHTQGNLGIGGFFNYQHKNLFRGAEILNIKLSGALQRQNKYDDTEAFNIYEYGAVASLETPSFILPIPMDRFYKRYNPKTNFIISYNYQKRPDYKRTITSASMGYDWQGTKTIRHFVSPIDLSSVYVSEKNQQYFDEFVNGTFLENNFKNYLIAGGNYSMIYQNKPKAAYKSFSYSRFNLGLAGNTLNFFDKNFGLNQIDSEGYYKMFELQYAQFLHANIDYRYNYYLNNNNSFVSRLFAGVAIPYGNANAIPFVKQYYAGGADGIRAWHPRDLGPGTYTPDSLIRNSGNYYPNQLGDIKLECNLEYRYSLNRSWKGAFFVDVGNVWLYKEDETRTGGEFKFDEFYKQLAIGTGFGIRYDLEFAVFRLDWGIKVCDPDANLKGSESWVLFNTPFTKNDLIYHIAVGYPF